MHDDVTFLRNFYYKSRLGRSVQRRLQEAIREFWPQVSQETLLGFGFAAPFLRPFLGEAARIVTLMPSAQGVMSWPPGENNTSVLCEETHWPLGAASVDKILFAHALETSERPDALLAEAWRVLAQDGRLILVIPNRLGTWARGEKTPFGSGRPFSFSQVEKYLARHRFKLERYEGALYAPPSEKSVWIRMTDVLEWAVQRVDRRFIAGVIVVEARKDLTNGKLGVKEKSRVVEALGSGLQPVHQKDVPEKM